MVISASVRPGRPATVPSVSVITPSATRCRSAAVSARRSATSSRPSMPASRRRPRGRRRPAGTAATCRPTAGQRGQGQRQVGVAARGQRRLAAGGVLAGAGLVQPREPPLHDEPVAEQRGEQLLQREPVPVHQRQQLAVRPAGAQQRPAQQHPGAAHHVGRVDVGQPVEHVVQRGHALALDAGDSAVSRSVNVPAGAADLRVLAAVAGARRAQPARPGRSAAPGSSARSALRHGHR